MVFTELARTASRSRPMRGAALLAAAAVVAWPAVRPALHPQPPRPVPAATLARMETAAREAAALLSEEAAKSDARGHEAVRAFSQARWRGERAGEALERLKAVYGASGSRSSEADAAVDDLSRAVVSGFVARATRISSYRASWTGVDGEPFFQDPDARAAWEASRDEMGRSVTAASAASRRISEWALPLMGR